MKKVTFAVSNVLIPASNLIRSPRISVTNHDELWSCPAAHSRGLDMLDRFFLAENPLLPFGRAIGHASKNDLGDLQARIAEADCAEDKQSIRSV